MGTTALMGMHVESSYSYFDEDIQVELIEEEEFLYFSPHDHCRPWRQKRRPSAIVETTRLLGMTYNVWLCK